MTDTGSGYFYLNKHKPGLLGGESTAPPAVTLRHPGTQSVMPACMEMIPAAGDRTLIYGYKREEESQFLGRLSAWMGQERSLLTAVVAKDGQGDTMEVPSVSKSWKYHWSASFALAAKLIGLRHLCVN